MENLSLMDLSAKLLFGDDRTREEVAEQLFELGSEATPIVGTLIIALNDVNDMVLYHICATLAQIGPNASDALPSLARIFLDGEIDRPTRAVAASALGQIGHRSESVLIHCLVSNDSFVRRKAAGALGKISKSVSVIAHLITSFGDQCPDVRSVACESMKSILKASALDESNPLEAEILSLLRGATISTIPFEALNASKVLLEFNSSDQYAIACLYKYIKGTSDQIKLYSVWYAAIAGPNALPLLSDLINSLLDPEPEIRQLAADSIGEIGYEAHPASSALVSLLNDHDPRVRGSAAYALGLIGPVATSTFNKLKEMLNDEDEEVTRLASITISRCAHL